MMTFLAVVLMPLGLITSFLAGVVPLVILANIALKEYEGVFKMTAVAAISGVISYGYIQIMEHAF